jgi:type I restriction enzyme S subunit
MKYYKLKELCTDIIDCPHSTPEWKNEGVRIIRNFNLKDGNLDFTDGYFVDEQTYIERTRRAVPEAGDIVISREAPMGVVGIIPDNLKCCLGQRLVLLKVDRSKCNPFYLLFILLSDFVQTQFKRADATGSIVSNLCIPDLKEIVIPVIEGKQENLASLLENINRKLQLNKNINDNLQAQSEMVA